uniref:FGGY carbohydrate kinase domain containing n=1 Tax=Moschus moschiferus TaxID=68415 RepID=A0A8C6FLF1_MOSMO
MRNPGATTWAWTWGPAVSEQPLWTRGAPSWLSQTSPSISGDLSSTTMSSRLRTSGPRAALPQRSLCSLVCKWTYSAEKGWDDSFWKMVGLEDLVTDNYSKIGNQVLPPGASLGSGLTPEAAEDLGLPPGIAVAASLIDAHAGGLGVIGADVKGHGLACEGQPVTSRLAVICGTSSCHMGISKNPIFVPGVWGPYFSAMVPGFWLNEGGQSVTGKLIDHMVQGHAAFPELQAKATAR